MKRYIEGFPFKLNGLDFKTLENSKSSIYALSEELNLIYVNPTLVLFANKNSVSETFLKNIPLGKPLTNAFFGEKVKNFYTENYLNVLKTGKPWRHDYECSSIDVFREFRQDTYRLKDGKGLIIINTLTIHKPMNEIGREVFKVIDNRYVNLNTGFVTQCCNCRRTQRAEEPEIWDWIPEWVKDMPNNCSHTICPICFDYFWKR